MIKSIIKILILTQALTSLSACAEQKFSEKLQPASQSVSTYDYVGIPSHDPPTTIALGGFPQYIQQHHTNEQHFDVGVESVIGKPILHKKQIHGNIQVETGYSSLQGWWGTAQD